jgi:hypothetical protein
MKKTILQSMLENVLPAVATRATIPVLECVLIEKTQETLSLTATDLNIRLSAQGQTHRWEDGDWSLCVDAKKLHGALSAPGDKATLTKNGDRLIVTVEANKALTVTTLHTLKPSEFPMGWEGEWNQSGTASGLLVDAIKTVAPCQSKDETRPIIMGVCLDQNENAVVATDGRHLAAKYLTDKVPFATVLKRTMVEALQLGLPTTWKVGGEDETAIISFEQTHPWGIASIQARPVSGRYPSWERVIPRKYLAGEGTKTQWKLDELPSKEFLEKWDTLRVHVLQDQGAILIFSTRGGDKFPSARMETLAISGASPCALNIMPCVLETMREVLGPEAEVRLWGEMDPLEASAHGTIYVRMPLRIPSPDDA